jgi:hypothetical protein
MMASRDPVNKGTGKTPGARQEPLTWGAIIGALTDPEARRIALNAYARAGWTADLFARRRGARECMCRCLTMAEDHIEFEHPGRQRERTALRTIRRRLENEL